MAARSFNVLFTVEEIEERTEFVNDRLRLIGGARPFSYAPLLCLRIAEQCIGGVRGENGVGHGLTIGGGWTNRFADLENRNRIKCSHVGAPRTKVAYRNEDLRQGFPLIFRVTVACEHCIDLVGLVI